MHSKWDIILVSFPFREDLQKTKTRPCVIIDIDKLTGEYVIIGISSVPHWSDSEYHIKYHKQANLSEGSVVMTDHIVRVNADDRFITIGKLDKTDRINIMALMSE